MKEWKWPTALSFVAWLATITAMFGLTDDPDIKAHLIGYVDTLVPFVVGAAGGGTVGALAGYARGKDVL